MCSLYRRKVLDYVNCARLAWIKSRIFVVLMEECFGITNWRSWTIKRLECVISLTSFRCVLLHESMTCSGILPHRHLLFKVWKLDALAMTSWSARRLIALTNCNLSETLHVSLIWISVHKEMKRPSGSILSQEIIKRPAVLGVEIPVKLNSR